METLRKLINSNEAELKVEEALISALTKTNDDESLIQSSTSEDLKENVSPLLVNENNNCLSEKLINELQTKYDRLEKEKVIIDRELCMLRQRMGREISYDSFRINELREQIETEQHLGTVFKLELQAKNEEINEKERRLQQYELVLFN